MPAHPRDSCPQVVIEGVGLGVRERAAQPKQDFRRRSAAGDGVADLLAPGTKPGAGQRVGQLVRLAIDIRVHAPIVDYSTTPPRWRAAYRNGLSVRM